MSKPQDLDLSDERLGGRYSGVAQVHGDGKIVAINGHGAENYWSGAQIAELLTALAEQRKALLELCDRTIKHGKMVFPEEVRRILGVKP